MIRNVKIISSNTAVRYYPENYTGGSFSSW